MEVFGESMGGGVTKAANVVVVRPLTMHPAGENGVLSPQPAVIVDGGG